MHLIPINCALEGQCGGNQAPIIGGGCAPSFRGALSLPKAREGAFAPKREKWDVDVPPSLAQVPPYGQAGGAWGSHMSHFAHFISFSFFPFFSRLRKHLEVLVSHVTCHKTVACAREGSGIGHEIGPYKCLVFVSISKINQLCIFLFGH